VTRARFSERPIKEVKLVSGKRVLRALLDFDELQTLLTEGGRQSKQFEGRQFESSRGR
jgi:hypothetical protein